MSAATEVITILGKRGSGKSTLAWELAKIRPRLLTIDPMSEHDESEYEFVCETFDEYAEAMLTCERRESFRILFRFGIESDSHDDELNQVLRVAYYRGNLAVLFEECWMYSDARGGMPKWMRQMYLTGRHQALCLIVTSQRPASVHKDIMAQTSSFYSGTMFESNDVRYLAEFLGKENAEGLRALPQFKFLRYRPGEMPEIVPNKI